MLSKKNKSNYKNYADSMERVFNFDEIRKNIDVLTENNTLKVDQLAIFDDIYKAYEYIKLFVSLPDKFEGYTELYEQMISYILQSYRPSMIVPGTIGSFIFGCFQQTYGDIDQACSPLCHDSIQRTAYNKSIVCTNQIWIQITPDIFGDTRFVKLKNDCKAMTAYIYVDKSFEGFTLSEITNFKKEGLSQAQVMVTHALKHHIINKMTSINSLPLSGAYSESSQRMSISFRSESSFMEELEGNIWIYVMVGVGIIIIAVTLYRQ